MSHVSITRKIISKNWNEETDTGDNRIYIINSIIYMEVMNSITTVDKRRKRIADLFYNDFNLCDMPRSSKRYAKACIVLCLIKQSKVCI